MADVTESADEASEGVDITLVEDITARVSLLYFVIAVYHQHRTRNPFALSTKVLFQLRIEYNIDL